MKVILHHSSSHDSGILVSLRFLRDEFARSHEYDLGVMAAALRVLDQAAGSRVVRAEPRRPEVVSPKEPPGDKGDSLVLTQSRMSPFPPPPFPNMM